MERYAELHRETKETEVSVTLSLDGGESKISTGVGFFDHMLTALAVHGGLGLTLHLECKYGKNSHHMIEALFKAAAHALKDAISLSGDQSAVLSSKGVL